LAGSYAELPQASRAADMGTFIESTAERWSAWTWDLPAVPFRLIERQVRPAVVIRHLPKRNRRMIETGRLVTGIVTSPQLPPDKR
jgi:hypothetical protein